MYRSLVTVQKLFADKWDSLKFKILYLWLLSEGHNLDLESSILDGSHEDIVDEALL